MEEKLHEYIDRLKATTAVKERIQSELRIAHEIQLGMLPKSLPCISTDRSIDIYAFLQPAREIGGDLYDYFEIDKDNICFLVGDVSDKGVPAALFMARSKSLIRAATLMLKMCAMMLRQNRVPF